jgi:hypothetical protein
MLCWPMPRDPPLQMFYKMWLHLVLFAFMPYTEQIPFTGSYPS